MKYWVAIFLLVTGIASAAPESSLRPINRISTTPVPAASGSIEKSPRSQTVVTNATATNRSLRPELRPRKFNRIAREQEQLRQRGAICGDPDIQGEAIGGVKGRITGCGLSDAVRVKAVSGIALSQNAVMDCGTAMALKSWVDKTAKPVLARSGGGLKSLQVAAHYACRTRNNRPGARISEHGRGRAIDISGVRLRDGTLITVRNGWSGAQTGPLLRKLHSGACGPFGTVLGPASDRYHKDHFHFDTARYRSGPYCR